MAATEPAYPEDTVHIDEHGNLIQKNDQSAS
jgi:hypothetical protein